MPLSQGGHGERQERPYERARRDDLTPPSPHPIPFHRQPSFHPLHPLPSRPSVPVLGLHQQDGYAKLIDFGLARPLRAPTDQAGGGKYFGMPAGGWVPMAPLAPRPPRGGGGGALARARGGCVDEGAKPSSLLSSGSVGGRSRRTSIWPKRRFYLSPISLNSRF